MTNETKHTATPWSQGRFLDLPQYSKMSEEWKKNAELEESKRVFSNFSILDNGRTRKFVARCETAEDAAHIVKCVNAHDDLVSALSYVRNELSRAGLPYIHSLMQTIEAALKKASE